MRAVEPMDSDWYVSGVVECAEDIAGLAALLADAGIPAVVGESSHFTSGRYVRISDGEARLTLDKVDARRYLLRGEGDAEPELAALCLRLSDALAHRNVTHRIELYDPFDRQVREYESASRGRLR